MATVVLKLFTGQGTGTDGQSGTTCFPRLPNYSETLYVYTFLN